MSKKPNVSASLLKASSHVHRGELNEAHKLYQEILLLFPDNARALKGLREIENRRLSTGHKEPHPSPQELDSLINQYSSGLLSDTVIKAQILLQNYPESFLIWNILGAARKGLGKVHEAQEAFRRATQINPRYADAHYNLGIILQDLGNLDKAIEAYQRAVQIKPDYADALTNMGNVLKDQGKFGEAVVTYERLIKIKPNLPEAHNNLGVALQEQGKLGSAIAAYKRAVQLKPKYASAYFNMGNALKDQCKFDESMAAYQFAIQCMPDFAEVYTNMGTLLAIQGRLNDAISVYQRALQLNPDHADTYNNMGITLQDQGKLSEAIAAYAKSLQLKPDYAPAYAGIALALEEQGHFDEAIITYRKALCLKPDYASVEAQMIHRMSHICDWSVTHRLNEICSRLGILTNAVPTFSMLSLEDNAERQLKRSVSWAAEQYKQHALALHLRPQIQPTKLRIGYFSADFHNHATLYLMAGLLREHDDTQFEIFAYSYGRSATGDRREKAEQDVDHFFDVTEKSNLEICNLARTHELDIAVDLKGYTAHTRSGIFQLRLAPVQINYLGYPGSMGADFMDYIIADPIVIPKIQRQNYSEKIIYLPHSYQPNDNCREIAITQTTRADFNLPNDAFVFCCFNNNYKISPREFDIWMRLLSRKEGSVLWLLKSNKWAEANLRKEAQSRCVDPNRLIFADHLPHDEHLARHKHADLFIDTFNYNAHTTASDALWSGLPVVTKQGSQFAARVAASLLNAVGLSEMITNTEREYEDLIFDLSINPEKLSAVREKLMRNRLSQPLFDTKRYARNLENGFKLANDLYRSKGKIEDIYVREDIHY